MTHQEQGWSVILPWFFFINESKQTKLSRPSPSPVNSFCMPEQGNELWIMNYEL